MRVSEKQLLVLMRVLEGSLSIVDRNDGSLFGYSKEIRYALYNDLINQQNNNPIEIKGDEDEDSNSHC